MKPARKLKCVLYNRRGETGPLASHHLGSLKVV